MCTCNYASVSGYVCVNAAVLFAASRVGELCTGHVAALAVGYAVVTEVTVSKSNAPVGCVDGLDAEISLQQLFIVQCHYLKTGLSHLQNGVILLGPSLAVVVFSPAAVVFPFGGRCPALPVHVPAEQAEQCYQDDKHRPTYDPSQKQGGI